MFYWMRLIFICLLCRTTSILFCLVFFLNQWICVTDFEWDYTKMTSFLCYIVSAVPLMCSCNQICYNPKWNKNHAAFNSNCDNNRLRNFNSKARFRRFVPLKVKLFAEMELKRMIRMSKHHFWKYSTHANTLLHITIHTRHPKKLPKIITIKSGLDPCVLFVIMSNKLCEIANFIASFQQNNYFTSYPCFFRQTKAQNTFRKSDNSCKNVRMFK